LHSLQKSKGGFIDWWEHPVDILRKYFLRPDLEIMNKKDYLLEMVRGHEEQAEMARNHDGLFLKYPDFIENFARILEHFGLEASKSDWESSMQMLAYDSKTRKKRNY